MITNLALNLCPSRQITIGLIIIHALTLASLSLYTADFVIKTLLTALILLHAYHTYRHYAALTNKKSISSLELNTREEWWLYSKSGMTKAELLGTSFITQYLIVLNFKTKQLLKTSVMLTRDSVSAEQWRKLRVYLTIQKLN